MEVREHETVWEEEYQYQAPKKERKFSWSWSKVWMVLFWLLVLFFGPGFFLTLTGLALTMPCLWLVGQIKKREFKEVIGNNDWMFFATLAMTLLSALMAYWNPLVPEGFGAQWWEGIKGLFGLESKATLRDSIVWGLVNRFFFGESYTYGWRSATAGYFIWSIVALFVSFWDETVWFVKHLFNKAKSDGLKGAVEWLLKDGFAELFWKFSGRIFS